MKNLFGYLCAGYAAGTASCFAFLLTICLSWPSREQQIAAIYTVSQSDLRQAANPLLTSQLHEYWAETIVGLIALSIPIGFIVASLVLSRIKPIASLKNDRYLLCFVGVGSLCLMFCFSAYRAILPVYDQYTIPSFLSHAFEAAVTR